MSLLLFSQLHLKDADFFFLFIESQHYCICIQTGKIFSILSTKNNNELFLKLSMPILLSGEDIGKIGEQKPRQIVLPPEVVGELGHLVALPELGEGGGQRGEGIEGRGAGHGGGRGRGAGEGGGHGGLEGQVEGHVVLVAAHDAQEVQL